MNQVDGQPRRLAVCLRRSDSGRVGGPPIKVEVFLRTITPCMEGSPSEEGSKFLGRVNRGLGGIVLRVLKSFSHPNLPLSAKEAHKWQQEEEEEGEVFEGCTADAGRYHPGALIVVIETIRIGSGGPVARNVSTAHITARTRDAKRGLPTSVVQRNTIG